MRKTITLWMFAILLATSCTQRRENNTSEFINNQIVDSLSLEKRIDLSENMMHIGIINSFQFLNKMDLLVTTDNPAAVVVYGIDGQQKQKIGKVGNGPFEYLKPSIAKTHDNKIYVWCSMLLKLIVFDLEGKPIIEYTHLSEGIKDFTIYKHFFCYYTTNKEEIVNILDLDTEPHTSRSFGQPSNEHQIIGFHQSSGALVVKDNFILFTPTNELEINKINIIDWAISKSNIEDKDFIVSKINKTPSEVIGDPQNMVYIFGSNMVQDLFETKNNIVLKAEIGNITMKNGQFKEISERRQKYYFLSKTTQEVEYTVTSGLNTDYNSSHFASNGEDIFTLILDETNSIYGLYLVNFAISNQKS